MILKNKKPLVSICCAAYNHEAYIEDALKGFLMQECDFEYEILIHDDASTDKTAEIIRAYERRYPDKIFPIYQTENQYSQGKKYSDLNYERVRGKYVAICEGDDYWTHPQKLAKQIKAMQEKPEFGLSFHPAKQLHMEKNVEKDIGLYLETSGIVPIENIIMKTKEIIPTASCIITADVMQKVLEFKSTRPYLTVGDIYIQFFGALKAGGAIFLHDVMSVYRFSTPTSWSRQWLASIANQNRHNVAMARSFKELNEMTYYNYSHSFEQSTIKRIFYFISVLNQHTPEDEPLNLELLPNFAQQYINALKDLLHEMLQENKRYILYGTGSGAKLIMSILKSKIDFILDGDLAKDGSYFMNKKILHVSQYKNQDASQKILISLIGRSDETISLLNTSLQKSAINFDAILREKNILQKVDF